MEIYNCEKCLIRLTDKDLETGQAVRFRDLVYCRSCADEDGILQAVDQERQKASSASGHHRRSTRRHRPVTQSAVPHADSGGKYLLTAGIVGLVAVLLVIVLAIRSSSHAPVRRTAAGDTEGNSLAVPSQRGTEIREKQRGDDIKPPERPVAAAFRPGGRRDGAPDGGAVLADFESGEAVSMVAPPAEAAIETLPLEAGRVLVVDKPEGDISEFGAVRVRFAEGKTVSGFQRLGFFAASGPSPARVKVGLLSGGSTAYLKGPDGKDTLLLRPEWTWHELLIEGGLEDVDGFIVLYNQDRERPPVRLFLDDITAVGKRPAVPAALAGEVVGGRRVLLSSDLEADDAGWSQGKRVEDASRPDSKYCYEAGRPKGGFSRRAYFTEWALKPRRDSLFEVPAGALIAFDYYLSGQGKPFMEVTVWDATSKQNWTHTLRSPQLDRWTRIELFLETAFEPHEGRPEHMPPGSVITELKIGIRPAEAEYTFRLDNLVITAPAEGAAQAQAFFSSDFENDAVGWQNGERVSDNVPPDSKWAYKAKADSGDKWAARVLNLRCWDITPGRKSLCTIKGSQFVEFDYFLTDAGDDEPLQVQLIVRDMKPNSVCRYNVPKPVTGRWTKCRVAFRDLHNQGGVSPEDGKIATELYVRSGPPDGDTTLIIDNFRMVQEGE